MRSFDTTPKKSRPRSAYRWTANVMILIGLAAFPTAVFKGVADANIYNSPFDVIDSVEDGGKGFLPIVIDPNSELGISAAPTLTSGDGGAAIGDEDLLEVMNVIRSSQKMTQSGGVSEILIPDRIVIPSINLDTRILLADYKEIPFWGKVYKQWTAPNAQAVGWHYDSATLGQLGNTVLNGHHNIYGEVFRYLADLEQGSIIYLYSGDKVFSYVVAQVDILPEKYQSVEQRVDNAKWTLPSEDERITLISCWPYESNTHRVIVVAIPTELEGEAP